MSDQSGPARLRVQGQGRAYAAVVGVTVGMLFAGLAVPLAFGRTPGSDQTSTVGQLDPSFADGEGAGTGDGPGLSGPSTGPGVTTAPNGSLAPTSGPADRSGPSAAPGDRPGAPAPGAGPGKVALTATDQGVTATSVKLGVVLLDIRSLEPLGFAQPHFTPNEQRQQYQTFIDQVNKSGGLNGRQITPVYKTYNALDSNGANSAAAICIQLAENERVFGAIGVLDAGLDSCLTTQYGIPAISNTANLKEVFRKASGLLLSAFPTFERGTANWGDLAVRSGLLRGRKVASLFADIPRESKPEASLVSGLKAAGQEMTYRAKLGSDQGTASSQMPVEVRRMQSAGVDTVFLVTNFITAIQFVQTAEQQNFRPQYVVSDFGSLTAEGLLKNMPRSFDGAYAFTVGRASESASEKDCRTYFNAQNGENYAAGNEAGGMTLFCFMVKTFSVAANDVGPQLTRKGLAAAFQSLKAPPVERTLPGSFGPGKTDFADWMRPIKYSSACKCYQAAGSAQQGRY